MGYLSINEHRGNRENILKVKEKNERRINKKEKN